MSRQICAVQLSAVDTTPLILKAAIFKPSRQPHRIRGKNHISKDFRLGYHCDKVDWSLGACAKSGYSSDAREDLSSGPQLLRASLVSWGLPTDDLCVAFSHGTPTLATDKKESQGLCKEIVICGGVVAMHSFPLPKITVPAILQARSVLGYLTALYQYCILI
jgi:hypothetical protein